MRPRFPNRPRQARMTAGLAAAHLFWWPFWRPSGRAAENPRKRSGGVGGKAWEGKFGLAAAAALVLAIGSITVAFAGSSGSGSADHRVQVIRLLAEHRGPRSRLRQHGSAQGIRKFSPTTCSRAVSGSPRWRCVSGRPGDQGVGYRPVGGDRVAAQGHRERSRGRSSIDFEDRARQRSGVPGEWHRYAARLGERARIGLAP
jgi:hypothetical protein